MKIKALYIHWPFCVNKCPYCDFNSYVRSHQIDESVWRNAFKKKLFWVQSQYNFTKLQSIFIGGGTPSLASAETISFILKEVNQQIGLNHDCEVTLESNPSSITEEKLKCYKDSGVNRISLGVQSFCDNILNFLGRWHTAKDACYTLELTQRYFERFSFDLIYAYPEHKLHIWKKELQKALSFGVRHLSLYQLTFEKGTAFYNKMKRGEIVGLTEDERADFYLLTEQLMQQNKLPSYEISNYSFLEQECRHNLSYWNYDPYVGIGPGAHSRVWQDGHWWQLNEEKNPEKWLRNIEIFNLNSIKNISLLRANEVIEEIMMMGLRLTSGIKERNFFLKTGSYFQEIFNFRSLIDGKFITYDNFTLNTTLKGRLCLDSVLVELLSGVSA